MARYETNIGRINKIPSLVSSSRTKEPPPTWIVHQVAQLEAHVRKLRKENKEWTARFRDEARSRATVMDMQRIIEELKHDRREVEQAQAHRRASLLPAGTF